MARLKLFIPLIVFVLLALVFFGVERRVQQGSYSPTELPSALIGRSMPGFSLPDLKTAALRTEADIVGQIVLLNVWATWCPSCHFEHPFLMTLAAQGVAIVSVDYKDDPAAAERWLLQKGDPYLFTISDERGGLGLDLGVTGAPETYLLDAKGVIRFRYQGALDQRVWDKEFAPRIAALQNENLP